MERSLGHRAPVLWLLLPTMVGFAAARALPAGWGGGWWLVLATAGLGLAVAGTFSGDRGTVGPVSDRPRRIVQGRSEASVVGAIEAVRPETGPTGRPTHRFRQCRRLGMSGYGISRLTARG